MALGEKPARRLSRCQVTGCGADLTYANEYNRRHRVCATHARADEVAVHGRMCRYCQQCGQFQDISEFSGARRSCEVSLEAHRARRAGARAENARRSRLQAQSAKRLDSKKGARAFSSGLCPRSRDTADQGLKRARLAACDEQSGGSSCSGSSLAATLQQLLGEDDNACAISAAAAAVAAANAAGGQQGIGNRPPFCALYYPAPYYYFNGAVLNRMLQQQLASASPAFSLNLNLQSAAGPLVDSPAEAHPPSGSSCSNHSSGSHSSGSAYSADAAAAAEAAAAAAAANAAAELCKSRLGNASEQQQVPSISYWDAVDMGQQLAAPPPWLLPPATPAAPAASAAPSATPTIAAADTASATQSPAAAEVAAPAAAAAVVAPAATAVAAPSAGRKPCLAPWAYTDLTDSVAGLSSIGTTLCGHHRQQVQMGRLCLPAASIAAAPAGGLTSSGSTPGAPQQLPSSGLLQDSMMGLTTAAGMSEPMAVAAAWCTAPQQQRMCAVWDPARRAAGAAAAAAVFGAPPPSASAGVGPEAASPAAAADAARAAEVAAAVFGAPPAGVAAAAAGPADPSQEHASTDVLDLQPQDLQLPPALGSTQLGVGHGLQQLQLPVDRHVPALESQQLVAALRLWQQGQQQQLQLLTPSLPLQQGNVSAPLAAAQPQWQQQPPSVSAALKCEDITLGKAAAAAGVADATHTVASTGLPAAYTAPAVDQAAGELHLRPTEAVPATAAAAADGSDNCSERDSDAVMDGWDELVAAAGPALTGEDDELLLGQALDIFFTAP